MKLLKFCKQTLEDFLMLQEQFWLKLTYREHSFALMPSIISYLSEIQGLDNEMIEIL